MKRKPEYRKPWKESTVVAPVIDSDVKIGEIFPHEGISSQVNKHQLRLTPF